MAGPRAPWASRRRLLVLFLATLGPCSLLLLLLLPAAPSPGGALVPLSPREVSEHLRSLAGEIRLVARLDSQAGLPSPSPGCRLAELGSGEGSHALCTPLPRAPCTFYSFGIGGDYSFDEALQRQSGCSGYAFDPSVALNSTLAPGVLFFPLGASSPARHPPAWNFVPVPLLPKLLGHSRIEVLKMDCEGCEFQLAEDVLAHDPGFFSRVDQFAVELHLPSRFAPTQKHIDNLALLYVLLKDAGLRVVDALLLSCDSGDGCPPALLQAGFSCDRHLFQNLLFARP